MKETKLMDELDNFVAATNISGNNASSRIFSSVPEPPEYLIITTTFFYVLIFVLGVFGNMVVIIVILANKNMKSTVNMLLINLCVADLLVMVICMPPTLVELHMKDVWYFGKFMCKLVPFLEFVVSSASIFTILTISIERYRVVCFPLSVNKAMHEHLTKILIMIWIIAILISAPILPIIVYKDSRLKDGTPIQVCRIPAKQGWKKAYFIANAAFIYVIPCFLLVGLYTKLCRELVPNKSFDHTTIEIQCHAKNEKLRLRWQVVNIIASVVCVFFICHLPYRVVSIWLMLEDSSKVESMGLEMYLNILYSARILLYLNHALNPILYNFVSTKFRMAFKFLFHKKKQLNSYLLYERKRTIEEPKHRRTRTSTRFQHVAGSRIEKEKIAKHDEEMKSSSSSNRQKINDFSPFYKDVCENESEENIIKVMEIENSKIMNDCANYHVTHSLTMSLNGNQSKGISVHLETGEGYVFAVRVNNVPTTPTYQII